MAHVIIIDEPLDPVAPPLGLAPRLGLGSVPTATAHARNVLHPEAKSKVSLAKPHSSAQARGSGRKPISRFVPAARNSAVQSNCRTAN